MKHFYFLFLFCIALLSCSKEKSCKEISTAYISEVNSPENAVVNQLVNIELLLALNGCDSFYKLESKGEFEREIVGKIKQEKCLQCITSINEVIISYPFTAKKQGNYTLKFKSSQNTYITKQITVK